MKKYGNTQRRYGVDLPMFYDRATRKVCLDIRQEMVAVEGGEGSEQEKVEGYSWIEIYLDGGQSLDYGAVKSKLIEEAYAPKDEFGLLMNAMASVIGTLTDEQRSQPEIQEFEEMNEWRAICAASAKAVCYEVGSLIPPVVEE